MTADMPATSTAQPATKHRRRARNYDLLRLQEQIKRDALRLRCTHEQLREMLLSLMEITSSVKNASEEAEKTALVETLINVTNENRN